MELQNLYNKVVSKVSRLTKDPNWEVRDQYSEGEYGIIKLVLNKLVLTSSEYLHKSEKLRTIFVEYDYDLHLEVPFREEYEELFTLFDSIKDYLNLLAEEKYQKEELTKLKKFVDYLEED